MRQTTLAAAVLVGVAVLAVVPAVGMAAIGDGVTADQSEAEAAPGERLAGVVGVQEVELGTDIEQRSFDLQLNRAATSDEQVMTVGNRVRDIGERIDAVEQRKAELNDQLAAGEINPGRYQAEMARVVAEAETLKQLNNQSARAIERLPAEQFENSGINGTTISVLQNRANNLTGPEIASIARNITGGGPGSIGPPAGVPGNGTGPPVDVPGNGTGPPVDDPGNGTGPPVDDPGNGTGPPADNPGNGTGPPVDDPGNGTGPPVDDPGNGTGPPVDDPGNGTGPPVDDPGNGTGPPVDDPGNGTGPPADDPGNGTGPPADDPGNGTDPPDDGPPGNGTDPPGNGTGPPGDGPPGNETSGDSSASTALSHYRMEIRSDWTVGLP